MPTGQAGMLTAYWNPMVCDATDPELAYWYKQILTIRSNFHPTKRQAIALASLDELILCEKNQIIFLTIFQVMVWCFQRLTENKRRMKCLPHLKILKNHIFFQNAMLFNISLDGMSEKEAYEECLNYSCENDYRKCAYDTNKPISLEEIYDINGYTDAVGFFQIWTWKIYKKISYGACSTML